MAIEQEIRELARILKDFDIYDASFDVEAAWKYLFRVSKTEGDPYFAQVIAKNKSLKNTIGANYRRRNAVARQLVDEDLDVYRDIYESELALLDNYCYTALGDYFAAKYQDEYPQAIINVALEISSKRAEARARREKSRAEHAVEYAERALVAAEKKAQEYAAKAEEAKKKLEEAKAAEAAKEAEEEDAE